MERKLTDSQIMEALKRCASQYSKCTGCIAHDECADGRFIKQVIHLIMRRDDSCESLRRNIEVLKADNKMLRCLVKEMMEGKR